MVMARAWKPSSWRGSGCALSVMAAAQIRRFCMPANPAEMSSFSPVPQAGAASITSPAPLISPGNSASERETARHGDSMRRRAGS
jgi:hypothetical protein